MMVMYVYRVCIERYVQGEELEYRKEQHDEVWQGRAGCGPPHEEEHEHVQYE